MTAWAWLFAVVAVAAGVVALTLGSLPMAAIFGLTVGCLLIELVDPL